jgi:hypothetical protein
MNLFHMLLIILQLKLRQHQQELIGVKLVLE